MTLWAKFQNIAVQTLILKEILWRIKKYAYFHKIWVHMLLKPLIFKLSNADLCSKTNVVQSENNKVVLLWVKYILCRSGSKIRITSKMEPFLKLVSSFMKSSVLDPVRVRDMPLLWTMKTKNNHEIFLHLFHTCDTQYMIHPLNGNHNSGASNASKCYVKIMWQSWQISTRKQNRTNLSPSVWASIKRHSVTNPKDDWQKY